MEKVACRRLFVHSTYQLLLLCSLLPYSTVRAAGSPACEGFREQAAFIMDARLKGERRQELAADLAGGGPPPPVMIRLITDVYELPTADLSGDARKQRLDAFHAQCLRDD